MARQAPHPGRANPLSVAVPQPMLARPSKTLPKGDEWRFEVKWDGIRIVARVAGGGARLWSRGGNDVTARHMEIATALAEAVGDREAVIDGELCALDPSGRPSFSLLQQGGGARVLYAFDVLELDGESLCDRPLDERRAALDELLPSDGDEVRISRLFDDGEGLLGVARAHGLEGVVAKRRTSTYAPGKRPGTWVKVKLGQRDTFEVVGFTRGQGTARRARRSRAGRAPTRGARVGGQRRHRADRRRARPARCPASAARARREPARRGSEDAASPPGRSHLGRAGRAGRGGVSRADARGSVARARLCWSRGYRPGIRSNARSRRCRSGKRTLILKNLDKVWWPDEGITKGDVLDHYHALADVVGPHLRGRPFTMLRFPDGIAGKHFFQKDLPEPRAGVAARRAAPGRRQDDPLPGARRRAVAPVGGQHGLLRPERVVRARRTCRSVRTR